MEFRLETLNLEAVLRLEFDLDALALQLLFSEASLPLFLDPPHVLSHAMCCLVESGSDLCKLLPLSLDVGSGLFLSLLALLNDFLVLPQLLLIPSHLLHDHLGLLPLQLFPVRIKAVQQLLLLLLLAFHGLPRLRKLPVLFLQGELHLEGSTSARCELAL